MKLIDKHLHPNPFFAREKTYSLNGEWDFLKNKSHELVKEYHQKIIVPFAVETPLSEINEDVSPTDVLHYRLKLAYPKEVIGERIRVHFYAVDQIADVYFNGVLLKHHEGGYLPFYFDVLEAKEGDAIELVITDDTDTVVYPKGKQTLHPKGMFYRSTSGIWGDVVLEILPKTGHIDDFLIEQEFDNKAVNVKKITTSNGGIVKGYVFYQDKIVAESEGEELRFSLLNDFHPWSPNEPNLYRLELHYRDDVVSCSFGLRKFEVRKNKKFMLFYLNNKPIFLNGLLDQGYHSPRSGLTIESESLLLKDLNYVKDSGFNFLRKHIKVESPRYYHLCDKLGIIVMQDFVSTGDPYDKFHLAVLPTIGFIKAKHKNYNSNRKSEASQRYFENEMPFFVRHFQNYTSICLWCLFNEGWGQFDVTRLTEKLRSFDVTRVIDSTSGWFDEGVGDIDSRHVYFHRPWIHNHKKRVLFLSEFGGYTYPVPDHVFAKETYGYKALTNSDELLYWLKKSYLKWLIPLIRKRGLCGATYTQLSDVEEETNGLVTYDREVYKIPSSELRKINEAIAKAFEETWEE